MRDDFGKDEVALLVSAIAIVSADILPLRNFYEPVQSHESSCISKRD
jgi:hypothetical protein